MKILCVCNGGNCRSVATAEILKGVYGHEAIAVGTYWIKPDSMAVMCRWADVILPVEPFDAKLPEPDLTKWKTSPVWSSEFDSKRKVLPLGPDIWGHHCWEEAKRCAHAALRAIGSWGPQ